MSLSRIITLPVYLILFSVVIISSAAAYDIKPEISSALDKQDTAQAIILLDEEIKTDPAYAPNYFVKGLIYYNRNQLDSALEQFETALDKKSKLYEALYYSGLVYLKQDKLEEARKAFDRGLKKAREEKAQFHNGMGLYYLANEEYSKADLEFRKAIQEGPDKAEYHANLGDANYFLKIYPLAINEYNQVIQMDTTYLDVYFRLARAYVSMGQFNDALDQLRTVLVRDSMYAGAWKEAGKLYTMAGLSARDTETKKQRFTEAIGSYRKYLELTADSADGEIFFNLGRSYFNLGGFAQADSALEFVLAKGDVPSNIYLYLGRAKLGEEKYQEGIDLLKKHIAWLKEDDPDWTPTAGDADLYRRIGDAYKALGDLNSAAENYVTASDLDPNNSRYAVEAALAFHQLKDFARALEYYQKRIDLGPDLWNIYLNAAYCTLNLEEYEKSIDFLLKVVELDSTQVKAYQLLATTYTYNLGNCEDGKIWSERWYEKDTANCDAIKNMGTINFGTDCQKNYLRAVTFFRKALDCYKDVQGMDNCGNSDIILYVAQAYHLHAANLAEADKKQESKQYFKNAFDWYNKVLKCDPGNAAAKQGVKDTEFEY